MSAKSKKVQIVARKATTRKPISPTTSKNIINAETPKATHTETPKATRVPLRGVRQSVIQPPIADDLPTEYSEPSQDTDDGSILGVDDTVSSAVEAAIYAHDTVIATVEEDEPIPLAQNMPIAEELIFEPIEITKQLMLYFRDTDDEMINAWTDAFTKDNRLVALAASRGYDLRIDIAKGSILEIGTPVDAFVSACTAFGLKKNGIDATYTKEFSASLEQTVLDSIIKKHKGLLPVGRAMMTPLSITDSSMTQKARYLIISPTTIMTSTDISETLNSYCCFKGVLEIVNTFNEAKKGKLITSIACSGLGTGLGNMPHFRCALQMRAALDSFFGYGFCTRSGTEIRDYYMLLIRTTKSFQMNPLYKI
jgi:O-acetyl-ADP-ribose deacetylase (regulator of RNase III)